MARLFCVFCPWLLKKKNIAKLVADPKSRCHFGAAQKTHETYPLASEDRFPAYLFLEQPVRRTSYIPHLVWYGRHILVELLQL